MGDNKERTKEKLLGSLLGQLAGEVQFTEMEVIWLEISLANGIGGNQVLSIRHVCVNEIVTFQIEMQISKWLYTSGAQSRLNWMCTFRRL